MYVIFLGRIKIFYIGDLCLDSGINLATTKKQNCSDLEKTVACENSRPSLLPAQVAFHEKDVCDLPPTIPY